jgi:hypothetical protein
MATIKTVLKMNHIEALVKVVNDAAAAGTATITLNSDLLKSNEELNGETPTVNLGAIECSVAVGTEATITRGGVLINNMFENTEGFELPWGADPQNNTSDIVVGFTGKGTVYLRLLKLKGYRPLFRPEQGVN